MATAQPIWRVLSCTYGGADFTFVFRRKLLLMANDKTPVFSFNATSSFFGHDPNPGINKVCVVVYQRALQSPDGSQVLGPPQSTAVEDGSVCYLEFTQAVADGTAGYVEPNPPSSKQYIVSAHWYTKDVTTVAQEIFDSYPFATGDNDLCPDQNIPITVSSDKLGPDPAFGTNKQFSVTYGSYCSGKWVYQAAVDLQQPLSWVLTIPTVVFPNNVGIQIIHASWGGKDISEFMRLKYQNETNELTILFWEQADATQAWTFSITNDTFGGDPNVNTPKAFVMIYQVGHMITQPWSPPAPGVVLTPGLPLSGIRSIAAREGQTVSLLANQVDLTPDIYTAPPPWALQGMPWVLKAIFSTVDVTSWYQWDILSHCLPPGGNPPMSLPNPFLCEPNSFAPGGDPWPNVQKNLTMLLGFPSKNGDSVQVCKYLVIQPELAYDLPLQNPGAEVGTVVWQLQGPALAYPKIVGVNTPQPFTWDPRNDASISYKWHMDETASSRSVNLVEDAGCIAGLVYNVSFDVVGMQDPQTVQFMCSSDPSQTTTLTLTQSGILAMLPTAPTNFEGTLVGPWLSVYWNGPGVPLT